MHLHPRASLFSNGHADHICNHNIGLLALHLWLHLWVHAKELRLMDLSVCAAKGKENMANENSKMMLFVWYLSIRSLLYDCVSDISSLLGRR